jgi:DNA-binding MarR family transcriptional regulator
MATLRRSGEPYALTPTDLYEAAMISSGSMTNRIDRLEKAGLVARRPNPADKRGTLVALTPEGLALIDRAVEAHVANQQAVVAGLDDGERRQLSALLARLRSTRRAEAGHLCHFYAGLRQTQLRTIIISLIAPRKQRGRI